MTKAMRALTRYAAAGNEDTGLGDSDFGVLEVLLHKGPLPVNTIGPIVDLTPGSISIAVDRLVANKWGACSALRWPLPCWVRDRTTPPGWVRDRTTPPGCLL
jgi:hypothetical protein